MDHISRRLFLTMSSGALAAPILLARFEEVPPMLDHILLGCNSLQGGIDFIEQQTGVRAAFGGVHPGRGTQNALLSLGEMRYLEIIAPDPAQPGSTDPRSLAVRELSEPRLVGWAAHPGPLATMAARLRDARIAFEGPMPGSRRRPDGRLLQWQTLGLADDASGLLPFFIEWLSVEGANGSAHPSADAPAGVKLIRFELCIPRPEALAKSAAVLGLSVSIKKGEKPQLNATLASPKGAFELSS